MSRIAKIAGAAFAVERVHNIAASFSPSYKNWFDNQVKLVKRKLKLTKTLYDAYQEHFRFKEDEEAYPCRLPLYGYSKQYEYLYKEFRWLGSFPIKCAKYSPIQLKENWEGYTFDGLQPINKELHVSLPTNMEERIKFARDGSCIKTERIGLYYNRYSIFFGLYKNEPIMLYVTESGTDFERVNLVTKNAAHLKEFSQEIESWANDGRGFVYTISKNTSTQDVLTGSYGLRADFDATKELRETKIVPDISVFSPNIQEFLTKDAFVSMRHIETIRKRSYLLTGPPGTGKTSLIRTLIQSAPENMSVIVVHSDGIKSLHRLAWYRSFAPLLVVIEDIDLLLDEGATKQCVLNYLDGLHKSVPTITVMTTNHPEKVLGEIRDRPGRVDRVVEVLPGDAIAREGQLKSIWQDKCPIPIEELVQLTEGMNVATLAEMHKRACIYEKFNPDIKEETLRAILKEIK